MILALMGNIIGLMPFSKNWPSSWFLFLLLIKWVMGRLRLKGAQWLSKISNGKEECKVSQTWDYLMIYSHPAVGVIMQHEFIVHLLQYSRLKKNKNICKTFNFSDWMSA